MIIEIGPRPYVATAFPEESAFFSTGENCPPPGPRLIRSLAELCQEHEFGEIEADRSPSESRLCRGRCATSTATSSLWRFIEGRSPLIRAIGLELSWRRHGARLIVLDHEDPAGDQPRQPLSCSNAATSGSSASRRPTIKSVFTKTAHAQLPTPRFRTKPRHARWVEKLRPLSIGLPLSSEGMLPLPPTEKRADVFFSGRVADSSTIRGAGCRTGGLAGEGGLTLDIPGLRRCRSPVLPAQRRRADRLVAWKVSAGTASATTRPPPAARSR